MDHFYLALPSDSSGFYFPRNTVADIRTKFATPIEIDPDKWKVGLFETSCPRGYKKRLLYNSIRLDSMEIKFPVKHYEILYDLVTNLTRVFESPKKEQFITKFSEYLNKYMPRDGFTKELLSTC